MEKQDLRIGNWVYSQEIGENVQISSINDEYVTFKDCVTWDYPSYDEINPIPLTEEILLKCGFIKGEGTILFLNGFYYDTFDGEFSFRSIIVNNINNLHQLQNLYHALTWEELEIEL